MSMELFKRVYRYTEEIFMLHLAAIQYYATRIIEVDLFEK